ncbi:FMN-binding negative transcriptional regulator [Microbacterium esteraromaticum]|uniref:FMN-binding negative transcriptional regulator n=1 Tax=Microbacterium esteraromaticum TaxID=57043 RepID=UPI0019D36AC4|nr:FMN-binding negative transcriptional regulator [Microbacterium esteraromaticum]MBN7793299.1 FMN-binding negative transcriptional regulator [Microbacterium esteraromaticum]MCA1305585.1 FMN-binding negative transcriptional regulator [Microbacterium esteraromaticum]
MGRHPLRGGLSMFEFEKYGAPSQDEVDTLVRQHPFALIVSGGDADSAPTATHAPVIIERNGPSGGLVGGEMLGHIARKNPQWQQITDGAPVLLIFSGPHDYVSPTTYADDPSVPTWDYAAVHLTARTSVLTDDASSMHVVTRTVEELERLEPQSWDMTTSLPTFERIVGGVVSFRFEIIEQRAVFKVSQDKPREVRDRIAATSRARGCRYGDVASLVERIGGDR